MTHFTSSELAAVTALGAVNSSRYDPTANPTGLAGSGYQTNFAPACNNFATAANAVDRLALLVDNGVTAVAAAAAGAPVATSNTSLAIGTGNLTFAVSSTSYFITGMYAVAFSTSNPNNRVFGLLTVGSGMLTIAATLVGGSGTVNDWTIVACGPQGAATGIASVSQDGSPQLGGNLDANGKQIANSALVQLATAGVVDLNGGTLKNGTLSGIAYKEGTPTVASGKLTIDYNAGPVEPIQLTTDITDLQINNLPSSGWVTILLPIYQDAAGGHAFTPATFTTKPVDMGALSGWSNTKTAARGDLLSLTLRAGTSAAIFSIVNTGLAASSL